MIWIVLGVVAVLGVAWLMLWWLQRRGNDLVSVVILRSAPASVTEADVRGAYRRTFGDDAEIHTMDLDATSRGYIAAGPRLPPLMVIVAGRPYMDPGEAADVASRLEHPVARAAIKEHVAWVSVDATGVPKKARTEELAVVHTMLGRLAAEFIDGQSMLLYLPKSSRVGEVTPETEELLRGAKLAEVFDDPSLHAPIIEAAGNDAVDKAIEQARERLPECLAAFAARGEASGAMVKARFAASIDGRAGNEYTWLMLKAVDGDALTGVVLNPPLDPKNPAKDSTVTVPVDSIVDWGYFDEDKMPHGFIVENVLTAQG